MARLENRVSNPFHTECNEASGLPSVMLNPFDFAQGWLREASGHELPVILNGAKRSEESGLARSEPLP
jgi:hypothetical protein